MKNPRLILLASGLAVFLVAIDRQLRAQAISNAPDAKSAKLIYDAMSGSVILSAAGTNSGEIVSFAIVTAEDMPSLNLDGLTLPFEDVGNNTDLTPRQVGQTLPLSEASGFAVHLLQDVFPTTMETSALSQYLETAIYASDLGEGGSFNVIALTTLPQGDYTGDSIVDLRDVELMCGQVAQETPLLLFDVTVDSSTNNDDVGLLLKVANRLPGDADFDGQVGFGDFLRLANRFGEAGSYSDGDFSCNGQIDFADFLVLAANFGREAQAVPVSVPEPTAAGWSLVFFLLVGFRRSQRRAHRKSSHRQMN